MPLNPVSAPFSLDHALPESLLGKFWFAFPWNIGCLSSPLFLVGCTAHNLSLRNALWSRWRVYCHPENQTSLRHARRCKQNPTNTTFSGLRDSRGRQDPVCVQSTRAARCCEGRSPNRLSLSRPSCCSLSVGEESDVFIISGGLMDFLVTCIWPRGTVVLLLYRGRDCATERHELIKPTT